MSGVYEYTERDWQTFYVADVVGLTPLQRRFFDLVTLNGNRFKAGAEYIAGRLGCEVRSLKRIVRDLRETGLLKVRSDYERFIVNGVAVRADRANTYTFKLPPFEFMQQAVRSVWKNGRRKASEARELARARWRAAINRCKLSVSLGLVRSLKELAKGEGDRDVTPIRSTEVYERKTTVSEALEAARKGAVMVETVKPARKSLLPPGGAAAVLQMGHWKVSP